MKQAIIITGNSYPQADAGAIRQHATAKIFKELGYNVFVLGYGQCTMGKIKEFDSVNYVSFRPASDNLFVRMIYRYFFVERAIRFIKKRFQSIDLLLVIDVLPKGFKKIEKLADEYNAQLIHDSVEWYSPEEFANGVKNQSYKNKEYTNTVAINNRWKVIAISRYLENYFSGKGIKTVRVPVVMDIGSIQPSLITNNCNKILFLYAGGPGKKDYLQVIVQGFANLNFEERKRVELHIVGVTKQQLIEICGVSMETIENCKEFVFAHGRKSHDETIKWVQRADFTVLVRDETLRYAKAGFPTKIVESMAYGTPVVCNISSDLGLYLADNNNAFIINGHEESDVTSTIRRIIHSYTEDSMEMRKEARKTAEKYFDYSQYCQVIGKLLE